MSERKTKWDDRIYYDQKKNVLVHIKADCIWAGVQAAIEWSDPSLKWYVFYNEYTEELVVGCLARDMWYMESEHGYNYYFPEELKYTGHIKIGPL